MRLASKRHSMAVLLASLNELVLDLIRWMEVLAMITTATILGKKSL